MKQIKNAVLQYTKINLYTAHVFLFSDALFETARGLKIKSGYLILLLDDENSAKIIHFGSQRRCRVVPSLMAAEIDDLVLGFNQAFAIQIYLRELTGQIYASM